MIVFDEISSTNDYFKRKASNSEPLPEFSAIMAINQTAGRGQRENVFFGSPGESLMFSTILYPSFLKVEDIFYINIMVSLAIQDWLEKLTDCGKIKWPNDIMVNDKKAGGVLIENTIGKSGIKSSIIGVGINVFQKTFPETIQQKATSLHLQILEMDGHVLQEMCVDLLCGLAVRYQELTHLSNKKKLLEEYNKHLFKRGVESTFISNGKEIKGMISHVDDKGLLHVMHGDELKTYFLKDISLKV